MIREILLENGYKFKRTTRRKSYSQTYVLFPMPREAYMYTFMVHHPCRFDMGVYDTRPSQSAFMTFMEIEPVTEENQECIKRFLKAFVKALPREPWKFTLSQKLQNGLLIPEYRRARKAWSMWGFRV